MKTYLAGKLILEEAMTWVNPNPNAICEETGVNRGDCIDKITAYFYGYAKSESYCAIFVWTVTDSALGTDNKLPKSAGALDLLNRSRNVFRVDKNPAPGAIFYRKSRAVVPAGQTKPSGHIGIVSNVDNGYLYTIEGNNSFTITKNGKPYKYEGIGTTFYPLSDIGNDDYDFWFIHTEETLGNDETYEVSGAVTKSKGLNITGGGIATTIFLAALAVAAGGGSYMYFKKK